MTLNPSLRYRIKYHWRLEQRNAVGP